MGSFARRSLRLPAAMMGRDGSGLGSDALLVQEKSRVRLCGP
jgi:hypothetical protein